MEENKSGLYIVAIVGVVAVIALVILVIGSDRTGTTSSAGVDSSGQALAKVCPYQCQNICTPNQYCYNVTWQVPVIKYGYNCTAVQNCTRYNCTSYYPCPQIPITTYQKFGNWTCITNTTCKQACGNICGSLIS